MSGGRGEGQAGTRSRYHPDTARHLLSAGVDALVLEQFVQLHFDVSFASRFFEPSVLRFQLRHEINQGLVLVPEEEYLRHLLGADEGLHMVYVALTTIDYLEATYSHFLSEC